MDGEKLFVKPLLLDLHTVNDTVGGALLGTINALGRLMEFRDSYTTGHQGRVAELAGSIGGELGLSKGMIEGLQIGSMVHDIGKLTIPAEILYKPAALTDLEFALVKTHSLHGYNVLKEIEYPWPVAEMVLQHHERLDGTGYPDGLSGDDILLEAQILGVADTVDAITTNRAYRPARDIDFALAEIRRLAGSKFNKDIVEACCRVTKRNSI